MQLLYSPMSPFARKVRVVAFELGLADRLALTLASPYTDESVRAINPLSKVPVLVLEDGQPIFDSPVICEYLEHLAGKTLTPAAGPDRWAALTAQAMADGMGDAALAIVRERLRDGPHRQDLFDRQAAALVAALDLLERRTPPSDRFEIGEIAVAAQLDYLDARRVMDWREGRPNLAAWHEIASRRAAMVATAPHLA
ncbi:glutathione S-transferase N-terminal domain-containing protein [Caulobacter sp. UNC279MFTsu5.1]|uniref:glutathione S-transferase N-terminal domain-containing protein n=1 Tax=Caulobacter sp. UNC279MFTsu5.1 TaxID=1502775 RepID=UPI0008E70DD5|nr:glutathione S-transferase N-terminal domain-containing protein [Caulobacter sp. UNC279MFTsu5.1]SFK13234.1 Glutathione S-transferase [Caulobacter sp. UNC279MFTsu5.1]